MATHDTRSGTTPWTLADFLATVLAGFVGVLLVALALPASTSTGTVIVASLLGQYAGHLIGLAVVVKRRSSSLAALGLDVYPSDGLYVLGGIALQIALAAAALPLAGWLGNGGSAQTLTESIPTITGMLPRIGLVAVTTIIAPVTEEMMFRGLLPKALTRRMGETAAFVLAALVFALFHLLGVAPGDHYLASAAVLVAQLFVVGLVLGWQARTRRRLGVSIFIHSGFNLLALLALLIAPAAFS